MDTWLKVVIGGAVAYFAYEMFYGSSTSTAPASWTAAGGTAAQWAALSAAGQAAWNGTAAASQTPAQVSYVVQAYPVVAVVADHTGGTVAVPSPPPPSNASGFQFNPHTLASLADAIQAQAAQDPNLTNGVTMPSGDHWNYYANRLTGKTFPPAWPSGPLTFQAYWSAQSPVIAAQTGLGSIAAGLGALIEHGRTVGMGAYVQQTEQHAFASPAQGPMTPFFFDADTANRSWN